MLGLGDLHVYDVRPILAGQVKPGTALRPVAVLAAQAGVAALRLAPDGRWLYYLDVKGEAQARLVRVDTQARTVDRRLDLGPRVVALGMSPDGKTLYAPAADGPYDTFPGEAPHHKGTLTVIDAAAFAGGRVLPVPTAPYDVADADDGRVFLSAGSGQHSKVLLVKDNAAAPLTHEPIGFRGAYLALSADQKRLYVADRLLTPSSVVARDLSPAGLVEPRVNRRTFEVAGQPFGTEILVTPDGRFLMCKGGAILWLEGAKGDPKGGKLVGPPKDAEVVALRVHGGKEAHPDVDALAFTRDGRQLAAGAGRSTKIYDAHTHELRHTLKGHTHWVKSVAFSPDGKFLASACWDKTVKLWDVAAGKELRTLEGHTDRVNGVAFSPDGKYLASAGSMDGAVLWDVGEGKELAALQLPRFEPPLAVAFSPDSTRLATGFVLWDVEELRQRQSDSFSLTRDRKKAHSTKGTRAVVLKKGPAEVVYSAAWSPDGKVLATGHARGKVALWDALTGEALTSIPSHNGDVSALAFSPDGKLLATGGNRGEVLRLREVPSGKILASFQLDQQQRANWPLSAAFTPDCKRLAVGTSRGEVLFWDVEQALRRQGKAAPAQGP